MIRFAYAAHVAVAWLCLGGLANAAVEVGWVEAVTSQAGHSYIQRGPERLSVTRFQTLQAGDVLSATKDARLEIRLGEGSKVLTVTAANSPYLIQRVGEVPGVWSRTLGWLREVALHKVGKGGPAADRIAIAASRTGNTIPEPLSFAIFANPEYFLLAGQRDLHFIWQGGVAPFSVRLTNKQTNALIGRQIIVSVREGVITSFTLDPGTYLLRVTDAGGASRLMRIAVVERSAMPKTNLAPDRDVLTTPQAALMSAITLASEPSNAWLLEAYQQLFTIELPEAVFLREAIQRGETLPRFNP